MARSSRSGFVQKFVDDNILAEEKITHARAKLAEIVDSNVGHLVRLTNTRRGNLVVSSEQTLVDLMQRVADQASLERINPMFHNVLKSPVPIDNAAVNTRRAAELNKAKAAALKKLNK